MSRTTLLRIVATVVLAGLAIAGYLLWIPVHRPNPSKLAALARTAPVTGLRGHPQTKVTSPSDSPLATVKSAAASTAGETGSYAVQWKGSSPVTSGSISLNVLPTEQLASEALADAKTTALASSALTRIGYAYGGTTRVSGIPGAKAAYYLGGGSSPTVTKSTPRATVVVYRAGRVIVGVNVDAKGSAATTTARALAAAEYHHLLTVGTDPVIGETSLPVLASVLYALVAVAVIAVAQIVPGFVISARHRQLELRAADERRARAARGKKVVKRHAARGYAARVESRAHGRR